MYAYMKENGPDVKRRKMMQGSNANIEKKKHFVSTQLVIDED